MATQSAILGPFFRHDHPIREKGASIHMTKGEGAEDAYMYGRVLDAKTGQALVGATVDVWQASTNGTRSSRTPNQTTLLTRVGLYEQQDDQQVEHNLRGKFKTDSNGEYAFYCIRPTPYPVPSDGPGGKLLQLMDRHPYRPAHIHLIVRPGLQVSFDMLKLCTGTHRGLQAHHHPDLRQGQQVLG